MNRVISPRWRSRVPSLSKPPFSRAARRCAEPLITASCPDCRGLRSVFLPQAYLASQHSRGLSDKHVIHIDLAWPPLVPELGWRRHSNLSAIRPLAILLIGANL